MNDTPNMPQKASDEKFCGSCGSAIKQLAEICPKCGVRQIQNNKINKAALLLLTFFVGGIGGHKFYLGRTAQGIVYLLFCWTFIPGLIALIEFFIYAFTSETALNEKYPSGSGSGAAVVIAVILGGFGGIIVLGILAALAIPRFVGASEKTKISEYKPVLKQIAILEEAFYQETDRYTENLDSIGFEPPSRSNFEYGIKLTSDKSFEAEAKLLVPIGDADPGDVVILNNNYEYSAVGDIKKYVSN